MSRVHLMKNNTSSNQNGSPLSGIRVVEFTTAIQGPAAGQYLANMGADVIKIEGVTGDGNRHGVGWDNFNPRTQMAAQFVSCNMGKRSIALDVKDPTSFEVMKKLIDSADVFLVNFTEQALERLGLSYDALKSRNPKLILAICSGFGGKGPDRTKKGFDGAAQARGGIIAVTGTPEQNYIPGGTIADTTGATHMALGIMTALFARQSRNGGEGQIVRSSLFGGQIWNQRWSLTHVGMTGAELKPQGPHYSVAPGASGVYRTRDGRQLTIIFPIIGKDPDLIFREMCKFGGKPEIGTHKHFNTVGKRQGNTKSVSQEDYLKINDHLVEIFGNRTLAEWTQFFTTYNDVAWSKVQTYNEVLDDEQALANGYIQEIDIPTLGKRKVVGPVVDLSSTPGKIAGP